MTGETESREGIKKFLSTIFGFLISLAIFVVIYVLSILQRDWMIGDLIPPEYVTHFVAILPGPLWTDTILLYLFPIASFAVFYFISPYTTIFFIKLHQLIYRSKKRFNYGIVKLGSQMKPFMIFRRSLIVSLFSFSISALIVQAGGWSLFRAGGVLNPILNEAEGIFLGTFFIIPFVLLLFFPIWLLEDSGVVIFRNYPEKRRPPIIEGTHAPYINVLQGYAGISTIIILITYVTATLAESGLGPAVLTPIILIVLPFFITGLFSFAVYFYEKNIPKLLNKIQPRLDKLNLSDIEIPKFNEMKKN
ncbi:MAG: hypothetical protein JSV62_10120 [Promethearchaeota archaeon]|nr:MAG: hypothetical protein JSV62_10120 [Candidatus Lokiarchaeota archaeon]